MTPLGPLDWSARSAGSQFVTDCVGQITSFGPLDRSAECLGCQFVLGGRWVNNTIGFSRLVASFRSAYEIRTFFSVDDIRS